MSQTKRYEYACDVCDYHSLVLETNKPVGFSDIAQKAMGMGWRYDRKDNEESLTCPHCLATEAAPVLETAALPKAKEKVIPTKLLSIAMVIFSAFFLIILWNNAQTPKEETLPIIVDAVPYGSEEHIEDVIDIDPDLAEKIEQDPERFLAEEDAVPEAKEVLTEEQASKLRDIAAAPVKTEAEIKKELLAQAEQDAVIDKGETPQTTPVEKPTLEKKEVEKKEIEKETEKKTEKPAEQPKQKEEKEAKKEVKPPPKPVIRGKYAIYTGTVNTTLGQAAKAIGLGFSQVKKIISIFSYSVNFKRLAKGDSFTVIYDKNALAKKAGSAKILAAEFKTRGKLHQRVYYTNTKGKSAYYLLNSKGPSKTVTTVTKGSKDGFLRYPLKYSRISSGFNLRRRHPISRRVRPHKGTDFAAPRGRKVWSTASGVVSFAGWQRGYGKVIKVSHHGGKYQTVYAHLSRIERGIRKGKQVRRKQVIGRVGSTGASTGNHLHYEFRVRGRAVNPLRVRLPKAGKTVTRKVVDKKEQKKFKARAKMMAHELKQARSRIKPLS